MNRIAHYLVYAAIITAIAVLWFYNGSVARADTVTYVSQGAVSDTVVEATILDNSRYPDILASLKCSDSDIGDMVSSCRAKLNELCPDGGTVKEMGETPAGVLPARIEIVVA